MESWIPEISDATLNELFKTIKPVVRRGNHLYYIEPVNLRNIAYTWDPKLTKKAVNLKKLRTIKTYHTYGYYGFFKPSVAEVIAQIPKDDLDKVVAFEIIESPDTVDDLNAESAALNAGYHVAKTQLYISKNQKGEK